MQLANLESREVLLAKIAGAMKASVSKAARVFDALRIKMEAGAPAPAVEAKTDAPAVEAVAEVAAETNVETPKAADAAPEVVAEAAPAAESTEN